MHLRSLEHRVLQLEHQRRIDEARARTREQVEQRLDALRGMHRRPVMRLSWEAELAAPSAPERQSLAMRVLAHDELAYAEALRVSQRMADLETYVGDDGIRTTFGPTTAHVDLRAPLGDEIPLASDDPAMPLRTPRDRNDVYQDYLCGLALRAARELLGVLPLDAVTVDVWFVPVEAASSPSSDEPPTRPVNVRIVSMLCARVAMDVIPWEVADASLVVQSLPHRMSFTADRGFYEVAHVRAG